jgi:hypothetical protein
MAIDPSIALGVRPLQLENPLTMYGTVANIQNAQNQNALAQYSLAAAQRGEQTENALNKAYMKAYNRETGKIDLQILRGELATTGVGSKLPAIEKQLAEVEQAQLARQKQFGEVVNQKLEQSRGRLAGVNTPEGYLAWHEANHADPVLGEFLKGRGVTAEQSRAQIVSELQKPGGLQRLIERSAVGLDKMPDVIRAQFQAEALQPTNPSGSATNALAPAGASAAPAIGNALATPPAAAPAAPQGAANRRLGQVQSEIQRISGIVQSDPGNTLAASRLKDLVDEQSKLVTQANAGSQFVNTPAGVMKIDKITGATTPVVDATGKPVKDVSAAQAEETKRANAEQEKIARFNAKIAADRQKLEQYKVDNPEKEIKEADGVFVAVDKRSGKATPITVGGKPLESGKPLNESEGKAVAFGIRMKEANSLLDSLSAKGTDMPAIGAGAQYGIGGIINAATASPAQQQVLQAKRNFITANLRKESGAVIGAEELDMEDQKYFPQLGDSEAVKAQKKKSRETAIRAMEIQAGAGAKEIKNFSGATSGLSPIDQEAMNWANSNPTDPRAKQIKDRLGRK